MVAAGGVILYPTDTIYGLGCLAGDRGAVARIYSIKGRPESRPSLVLVDSIAMADGLAASVPPGARKLMESCWPGPLTILLPGRPGLPAPLTAGGGLIGIRLPDDDFCRRLVSMTGGPVVSTSANRTGEDPPADFTELMGQFSGEVDLAVDAGRKAGKPSTVADLSGGRMVIVREGAYSESDLRRVLDGNLDNRSEKV